MKTGGILRSAGIGLAMVIAAVSVGAAPAHAATEHEVATWITEAALDRLEVTVQDAALAASLEAAIADALAAGLIALPVQEIAEDAIDDAELVSEDEVDDALDDELEEQDAAWSDVSAEWHAAFDLIKADFADCREAAEGGADLCAHLFRYDMQVNHVTAWLARHEAKVEDISALTAEEQAAALAKLDRKSQLAEDRLERARVQLEKKTGVPVETEAPADDEAAVEPAPPVEDGSVADDAAPVTGQSDNGNKGKKPAHAGDGKDKGAGKGNNGNGNGKSDR
ncbi:hypothetical protein [Salinibacterium sp. ZJ454]|uniref:hypothetical protein n=1 Tax=Salinibacterium sp. ZJ454 TaxID=2708339 RepID=UPI00141DD326|nr:hypothetical protein [Salinibacterium sp. ZJ454]